MRAANSPPSPFFSFPYTTPSFFFPAVRDDAEDIRCSASCQVEGVGVTGPSLSFFLLACFSPLLFPCNGFRPSPHSTRTEVEQGAGTLLAGRLPLLSFFFFTCLLSPPLSNRWAANGHDRVRQALERLSADYSAQLFSPFFLTSPSPFSAAGCTTTLKGNEVSVLEDS